MMRVDYNLIDKENAAEFLVVSVTRLEFDTILEQLQPVSQEGSLEVCHNDQTYYIGKLGQYNVICCKCKESGTIGANSVTMTIVSALQDWPCIKGVFMPGICFGLKPDEEQHRSDVIASEKIFSYELQEVGEEVKYKLDKRTSIFDANGYMLTAFENANKSWERTNTLGEKTKAVKGNYVSGNKRFVDDDPIKTLSNDFPQATVGDMEGQGLASACNKFNMPWLLMKGISDFGARDPEDAKYQKDAVSASVEALLNILNNKDNESMRALAPDGPFNYFYHGIKAKLNNIFFVQYLPDVEEFYIERKIDQKINLLIKTGCCWIFGDSGVGKSVSISRALIKNDINYILCDLSRHSRSSIDEIFAYIYCSICLKTKETPESNLKGFDDIAEKIISVVCSHYRENGLYVLIEEIPFDFGSEKFMHFVEALNSLIISCSTQLENIRFEFILSTIDTPEPHMSKWQLKVKNKMKFIKMERWSQEECFQLVNMISSITNINWNSEIPQDVFIERMEYSPARIKKFLNDVIRIGANEITNEIYEIICLG